MIRLPMPSFTCIEKVPSKMHVNVSRLIEAQSQYMDPIGLSIKKAMPSVGTVIVEQSNKMWNGSGFLISNNRFLTAGHVVKDVGVNAQVQVTFDDKTRFPAKVIYIGTDIDVAILLLEEVPQDIQPLKFAKQETVEPGEPIAVIGSPSGIHNVAMVGRVSGIGVSLETSNDPTLNDIILIDASIEPGSSGSPVIDLDSNVIGVVTSIVGDNADKLIGQIAVSPAYKIVNILQETHVNEETPEETVENPVEQREELAIASRPFRFRS